MKSVGVCGIFREACKIISSQRKIFYQITLAFILPLSLISLAQTQVSQILFAKIINDQNNLAETHIGTPKYDDISRLLFSESIALLLLKSAYFLLSLIFSLLATSAVAYTAASIYSTGQEVTFSKVLSVIPKVWKRLIVTFLTIIAVTFVYTFVAAIFLLSWIAFTRITANTNFLIFFFVLFYLLGVVYMSIVWQLAYAVSVLENSYGFEAMKRSRQLIKGKVGVSVFFLFGLGLCSAIIVVAFQRLVINGELPDVVSKAVFSIIFLLLESMLVLYGYVLNTVIYLVCKSNHNESMDKLGLPEHLAEAYSQEYVPFKGEDVKDVQAGFLMV